MTIQHRLSMHCRVPWLLGLGSSLLVVAACGGRTSDAASSTAGSGGAPGGTGGAAGGSTSGAAGSGAFGGGAGTAAGGAGGTAGGSAGGTTGLDAGTDADWRGCDRDPDRPTRFEPPCEAADLSGAPRCERGMCLVKKGCTIRGASWCDPFLDRDLSVEQPLQVTITRDY